MKKILIFLIVALAMVHANRSFADQQQSKEVEVNIEFDDNSTYTVDEQIVSDDKNDNDSNDDVIVVNEDSSEEENDALPDDSKTYDLNEQKIEATNDPISNLLALAQREGMYSEDIMRTTNTIAAQQSEINSLQVKIESRSKFITFLIGPDYKSIKNLQQDLKNSTNNIESLKAIAPKLENDESRQFIGNQVAQIEQKNIQISQAISAFQKKFSLFGWLVRLFV